MNKNGLHLALLLALGLSTTSCSGPSYKRAESIQSKMNRFTSHQNNINIVPNVEVLASTLEYKPHARKMAKTRGPASVKDTGKNDLARITSNNKKLYFLTLYSQYGKLKSLLPKERAVLELRSCPNFHSGLLEHKESFKINNRKGHLPYQTPFFSHSKYKEFSQKSLALYPELSLPVSKDSATPRVIDILKNKDQVSRFGGAHQLIETALEIHLSKTYTELRELCESGQSDNYYTYENLTTHIKRKGPLFRPSNQSMKVLLKTTVFSNWAILQSLELQKDSHSRRAPASSPHTKNSTTHQIYAEAMAKKLDVTWTKSYFETVKELRH